MPISDELEKAIAVFDNAAIAVSEAQGLLQLAAAVRDRDAARAALIAAIEHEIMAARDIGYDIGKGHGACYDDR